MELIRDNTPVLVGTSPRIRQIDEELTSAARSDAKVLVTGESGVGKEVVARLVHQRSTRRNAPLVTINCAGIPDTLLASELFGHVRGSFTDAYADKRGWLELADRGTAFLDEIGEMTPGMQALLLRFLETGEIQPVGSARPRGRLDVRVIAATNQPLADRVEAGTFRDDLFYRLHVIHIEVPPLRERPDDIPSLIDHFIREFAIRYRVNAPLVNADVYRHLASCPWPGNVRQIRNFVEALVVRAYGAPITLADLPRELFAGARPPADTTCDSRLTPRTAPLFERMVVGREKFWTVVYEPFMSRDLTREDLRGIVYRGLEATGGNYRNLVSLFNMTENDYRPFLTFLRRFKSHLSIREFRPSARLGMSTPVARASGE